MAEMDIIINTLQARKVEFERKAEQAGETGNINDITYNNAVMMQDAINIVTDVCGGHRKENEGCNILGRGTFQEEKSLLQELRKEVVKAGCIDIVQGCISQALRNIEKNNVHIPETWKTGGKAMCSTELYLADDGLERLAIEFRVYGFCGQNTKRR